MVATRILTSRAYMRLRDGGQLTDVEDKIAYRLLNMQEAKGILFGSLKATLGLLTVTDKM